MAKLFANSGDADQMPHSAASDLGLHYLPVTLLRVSRLQWVMGEVCTSLNPPVVFLQTIPRRFLWCSLSLGSGVFICGLCFVIVCSSSPFGASGSLFFVIVAFPGYLHIFHMWCSFCHCMFLISPSGVSGQLCFVIMALHICMLSLLLTFFSENWFVSSFILFPKEMI